MLKRYSRKGMEELWSEWNKFFNWLLVEVAVLRTRVELGEINCIIPANIEETIRIDPDEINRIEKDITKHDVIAFLMQVSPQFPEELRSWLHRGLTSYDIVDTAMSLQLFDSVYILIRDIEELMAIVKVRAMEYKYTPEIGRTHLIHAEPITFGVKLANWYAELKRNRERLKRLSKTVSVGKISGAVGMFTLNPEIERLTCEKLHLRPVIATQIISRDIIAEYMAVLGIVASTIGKISTNIRLLAGTDTGEVMEFFDINQKGSSAMPHKKNPIGSENLSGLSRIPCVNVQVAFENNANCWHERSLDNSGSERVIIADSAILLDYEINRLTGVIEKMLVFPDIMTENLNRTKGLIFSQDVMMLVADKSNLPREEAHTLVRDVALECWKNRSDFFTVLQLNEKIMKFVTSDELRQCFDVDNKLRHVDYIFKRVFREQERSKK